MSDFRTDSFESGMNGDRVNLPLLEFRVIPDNHGCTRRQGDRKMNSIAALCHELNELVRQGCQYPPQHREWAGLAEQRLFDDTLTRNSKDLMVTKNREIPTQSDPDKCRLQQRSFLESVLEEMDEQWRKPHPRQIGRQ